MDEWTIRFHPHAMRELYGMVRGQAPSITAFIDSLRSDPLPGGVTPVHKSKAVFRYAGDGFVVVYKFLDKEHAIKVLAVRALKQEK